MHNLTIFAQKLSEVLKFGVLFKMVQVHPLEITPRVEAQAVEAEVTFLIFNPFNGGYIQIDSSYTPVSIILEQSWLKFHFLTYGAGLKFEHATGSIFLSLSFMKQKDT